MIKTLRDLAIRLLQGCGEIDDPCYVKIVKRDAEGVVVKQALLPVHYIDASDNICVEHSQIRWKDYTSSWSPDRPDAKEAEEHMSFDKLALQLENAPNSWMPGLLRRVVEQCLRRDIFVKGGMDSVIRDVKERQKKSTARSRKRVITSVR